jgi:hypothetical protein
MAGKIISGIFNPAAEHCPNVIFPSPVEIKQKKR